MSKRLAIWGWWQGHNLGDKWIKRTLSGLFPDASFINTEAKDFSNYGFVICGGGGLFAEDTIPPWTNYSQDTPYGMLGLGAEFPHKTDSAYRLSRNAEFFYIRDKHSLDCMHISDVDRSYDITFASPLSFEENDKLNLNQVFFVWRDPSLLLKRPQFRKYIRYKSNNAAEYKRILSEEFDTVKSDDFQTDSADIERRISGCGFVISGRYHGIIAAIQRGLPCIAIDLCPKLRTLMKDCGLEEYCIKISETKKLPFLIRKAKSEYDIIRQKQLAYRDKAYETLLIQLGNVKARVDRILNPLRILYYGSYWMADNDVVKVMADDLGKICNATVIDLKTYTRSPDIRVKTKRPVPNGQICTLDTARIKKDVEAYKPDAVVLNSGGLCLEDAGFKMLSENNIISVGIELSDPDVYKYNGALYAHKFDLFYTNSKHSLENQYDKKKVNIRLLPFAASTDHHFYMPDVERKFDLVVVAHARPDRLATIKKLQNKFNIGLYGRGWSKGFGEVHGINHTRAINRGLMYLSFAKTTAGFFNVKSGIFEAMACNQVVITKYMDELADYFEIGREIICYENENELADIIEYYLKHGDEREAIRQNAYRRFLKEHTYLHRWQKVKQDILKLKG